METINLQRFKGMIRHLVGRGVKSPLCGESTILLKDDWENFDEWLKDEARKNDYLFDTATSFSLNDEDWVDKVYQLADLEEFFKSINDFGEDKISLVILTYDTSLGKIKDGDALTKLCVYHTIDDYKLRKNTALLLLIQGDEFEHDCVDHCKGYSITY